MAKAKETPKEEVVAKEPAKELAKVETASTAIVAAPAMDLEADAGMGLGNISARDMLIPYFSIIQSTAKCLIRTEPNYIKEAKSGNFLNTASSKTYDGEKGVIVIFCDFATRYTEWTPIDKGGGLVAMHGDNESVLQGTTKDEKGRDMTPRGTQIVKSADYPAIIYDPETGIMERVMISMTSTQLKKSRKLNTYANGLQIPRKDGKGTYNPPLFYMAYHVTSVPEKNESGNWFGYKIDPYKSLIDLVEDEEERTLVYNEAKTFMAQMRSGAVKADQTSAKPDSEIPF